MLFRLYHVSLSINSPRFLLGLPAGVQSAKISLILQSQPKKGAEAHLTACCWSDCLPAKAVSWGFAMMPQIIISRYLRAGVALACLGALTTMGCSGGDDSSTPTAKS